MKVIIVLCTILVAVYGIKVTVIPEQRDVSNKITASKTLRYEEDCAEYVEKSCAPTGINEDKTKCNSVISGFDHVKDNLQAYANDQMKQSYNMLLLASSFGTHKKNRPGFEKLFRDLSDKAFEDSIKLIKHITMRGGKMSFNNNNYMSSGRVLKLAPINTDVNEIISLGTALDIQKYLSSQAHHLHERISHSNNVGHYDPEIAHFIEEEFIEDQAKTIRKLSGYTNELVKLLDTSTDSSLSLYLFDEILSK